MKSKFYCIVSLVVLLAFVFVKITVTKNSKSQLSETMMANIEALAYEEGSFGGNTVDCYSSSEGKKGASYYDCGTCARQFNSVGVGSTRTCVVG